MTALDESDALAYTFMAGGEPFEGILHISPDHVQRFEIAPFHRFGRFGWQWKALTIAFSNRFDAIILLGDPNILSNWLGAAIARLRGIPVLFWAHGWRKMEGRRKALMRNLFFRLSNHLLVYAPRGRELGIASGFPTERITVVYNSLDTQTAAKVVAEIESGTLSTINPRGYFPEPGRPLITCSARITRACRFDLLFEAASRLAEQCALINILLVGDGPERPALERMAAELNLQVHFFGECYNEDVVGQIIYHADLVVSPGKIGLTAMHSLMYGTPAITHSNFDEQMPEFEAIEEGRTGTFFKQNDAHDLADAITRWLNGAPDRAVVRAAAREVIRGRWSPEVQAEILDEAILKTHALVKSL